MITPPDFERTLKGSLDNRSGLAGKRSEKERVLRDVVIWEPLNTSIMITLILPSIMHSSSGTKSVKIKDSTRKKRSSCVRQPRLLTSIRNPYRLGQRKHLLGRRTSTTAKTFANVASNFDNHFSIISTHLAWKMSTLYPGIQLVSLVRISTRLKLCRLTQSCRHICKTGHLPLWKERERLWNITWKTPEKRAKRAKLSFFIVPSARRAQGTMLSCIRVRP